MTQDTPNENEGTPPPAEDSDKSRGVVPPRVPWHLVLRLVLSVALVAYLVQRSDPHRLWESLKAMHWVPLAEAALLYVILQVLSSYKWGLILQSQRGHESLPVPPLRQLVAFYFMGMFTNLFFPSSLGGDTLRTVMVAPFAGGIAKGALSILMERATGFVALVTIGLTASLMLASQSDLRFLPHEGLSLHAGALLLALGAGICVLFFGATLVFRQLILADRIPRWTPQRLRSLLRGFAECFESFGASSRLFCGVIVLSLIFQLSYVVLNQLMMESANVPLSFTYLCFFVPVTSIILFIPLTPNGFGVRELTVTALLSAVGIPQHQALLFCAASYTVTLAVSLPGAVGLLFLRPDLRRLRLRKAN